MRSMDIVVGSGFQAINARRVVQWTCTTTDVWITSLAARRKQLWRKAEGRAAHETFRACVCVDVLWGPIFPRCCLAGALDGFAC